MILYSVVDIESSGGKFGAEKIIEIAIYKTDGVEILDQFISLVNPEKEIDPFVIRLTQITNKMVLTAPKFHELAKRIVEITEDSILVGHNVSFDYRMLRQEFGSLGYDFQKTTLDTLELSEKLFPGKSAYGLENITKELGIPNFSRHRASGDAMATFELLKLLLNKDTNTQSLDLFIKKPQTKKGEEQLFALRSQIKKLPLAAGVFYFFDVNENVIYLEDAQNLSKFVHHFLVNQIAKESEMVNSVAKIGFELTGNPILAKIRAKNLLKHNQHKFNSVQHNPLLYGITKETNPDGFFYLKISKRRFKENQALFVSDQPRPAKDFLYKLSAVFDLCPKINGCKCHKEACKSSDYFCVLTQDPKNKKQYNQNFAQAIKKFDLPSGDFILEGKGCNKNEKSFVLIENQIPTAYGYFALQHQIKKKSILKNRMILIEQPDQETKSMLLASLLKDNQKITFLEDWG